MSQVVGSKKFHALEVVDSAKFDNEIVFKVPWALFSVWFDASNEMRLALRHLSVE